MSELDDLCRLEELLAAEHSDDGEFLEETKVPTNLAIEENNTNEQRNRLFLEDVTNSESEVLTSKKIRSKSNKKIENVDAKFASAVHTGDTDSSDDEDKRNYMERKYNDYGYDVKKILEHKENERKKNEPLINEYGGNTSKINVSKKTNESKLSLTSQKNEGKDIYLDPVFGIRIIKPLVSGAALTERMQGREAVDMNKVKKHVAHGDLSKDWVIAGAIVRKSKAKESQKGSQFCIWTVSDLKNDLKTVSLFLFRNAYKQLWKTNEGTVIGILNPSVLDKRDDSQDQACLSVDNPDRVMILGTSKDFGFCKSRKKNGDPCTSFVNMNQCQYCIFHIKQEYQKFSKRPELQSISGGRGIHDLRNKVLGKDTYIYGGKSYSAIPALKNTKNSVKDKNRLQSLSDFFKASDQDKLFVNKAPYIQQPKIKMAARVDAPRSQRLKDLERLEFLRGGKSEDKQENLNESSVASISSPGNTKTLSQSKLVVSKPTSIQSGLQDFPILGFGLNKQSTIDLNVSYSKKQSEKAKTNALKWIQKNGPLNKSNPNNVRGTLEGKKRALEKLDTSNEEKLNVIQEAKKPKTGVMSDNFKKMLEVTSAHANLIVQHDDLEVDKYFNKLEAKERMEEKMLNTFKVACKAVRCLKCAYTSFSASEKCKVEKHPLKVFDSFKRFFKCLQCGNRTISLDLIPLHSCRNCKSSKWQRAAMIAEKKGVTIASTLSIRGEEEQFIGSIHGGANINLLVPE